MNERERKFQNLEHCTHALATTVTDVLPQMEDILDGKTKLPDSCPSKESMAELVFRQIEKMLFEVDGAVKDIRDSIFE